MEEIFIFIFIDGIIINEKRTTVKQFSVEMKRRRRAGVTLEKCFMFISLTILMSSIDFVRCRKRFLGLHCVLESVPRGLSLSPSKSSSFPEFNLVHFFCVE